MALRDQRDRRPPARDVTHRQRFRTWHGQGENSARLICRYASSRSVSEPEIDPPTLQKPNLPAAFRKIGDNAETTALQESSVSRPRLVGLGFKTLVFWEKTGAGEGIRTLDPNLGKVVLYP